MKRHAMLLAGFVLAALPAGSSAQGADGVSADQRYFSSRRTYEAMDLSRARKNYIACLASDNEGVVQSALAQVAMIKLILPGGKFEDLQAAVNSLAVCGKSPETRYEAYLTGLVFDSPGMFRQEAKTTYQDADQLFVALSGRVQSTLIGANDRKYVRPR